MKSPRHVTINSKRELSDVKHFTNKALQSSVPYKSVNHLYDVDSKVPELKLLVNDCLRPITIQ